MDVVDFPPLYTLQPVATTRAKQLEVWRGLVLKACDEKAVTSLDLPTFPAFTNDKIKRSLDMDGRRAVGDALVEAGLGEWEDAATKTRLRVSARSAEAWAALIYEWASQTARVGGSICTLCVLGVSKVCRARKARGLTLSCEPGSKSTPATILQRRSWLGSTPTCASRRSRYWRSKRSASCSRHSRWMSRVLNFCKAVFNLPPPSSCGGADPARTLR